MNARKAPAGPGMGSDGQGEQAGRFRDRSLLSCKSRPGAEKPAHGRDLEYLYKLHTYFSLQGTHRN